MVGALNMMRRRRFAGGGFASEVLSDPYDDRAVPPPGQNDGALDYEASQRMPGTTPDTLATTPAPPQQGALQDAAENAGAANRINRASQNFAQQLQQQQNVSAILTAGGQPPSPMFEMAPTPPQQGGGFLDGLFGGKTNLPLLAAAGAMLAPSKSGSFSEALGNAFTAAVPVAEKERQMDANREIWGNRIGVQQQNANTNAARQAASQTFMEAKARNLAAGMDEKTAHDQAMEEARFTFARVAQQNADTRQQAVTNRADLQNAQASLARAREAALRDPNSKPTTASVLQGAIEDMMTQVDPETNDLYTRSKATMVIRGTQSLIEHRANMDENNAARTGIYGTRVNDQRVAAERTADQRWQQIQNTQEYRDTQQQFNAMKMDQTVKSRAAAGARAMINANPKLTYKKALETALASEGIFTGLEPTATPTPRQRAAPSGTQQGGAPLPKIPPKSQLQDGAMYDSPQGPVVWNAKTNSFDSAGQ